MQQTVDAVADAWLRRQNIKTAAALQASADAET